MILRLPGHAFIALTLFLLLTTEQSESLSCGPCGGVGFCPDPPICINGLVPDMCKCCMVCGKGEGESCGGLWDMLGACGDNLVCVKFQSYPDISAYPHGKCRYQPTKRPLIIEDEFNTTTAAPTTITETVAPTTTSSPDRDEDNALEVMNFRHLTYREWVLMQLRN